MDFETCSVGWLEYAGFTLICHRDHLSGLLGHRPGSYQVNPGLRWDNLDTFLLSFGGLLGTIEALLAPFVTLLPLVGSPLGPSRVQFCCSLIPQGLGKTLRY